MRERVIKPEWAADVVRTLFLYGITQKEVADRVGITNRYLCMLLAGSRKNAKTVSKIQNAVSDIVSEFENHEKGCEMTE